MLKSLWQLLTGQTSSNNERQERTPIASIPSRNNAKVEEKEEEKLILDANGQINGHDYVDLGLPSGLLWATENLGGPIGDLFLWGTTSPLYDKEYTPLETKKDFSHWRKPGVSEAGYNLANYPHCKEVNRDWSFKKYAGCLVPENQRAIDANEEDLQKNILDLIDDAANVNWGANWKVPSKEDWEELELSCNWEICRYSYDLWGYKCTGLNGNFIFLPFAGYAIGRDIYRKTNGYYMCSTCQKENWGYAFHIENIATKWHPQLDSNYLLYNTGCLVRPVSLK